MSRIRKPIILSIPDKFINELDYYLESNPPAFVAKRVYFYQIINHIINKQIIYSKAEYFSIDKKYLSLITASNIDKYIKILSNGGFIISDNIYRVGTKALWYKINENFISDAVDVELDAKHSKKIMKTIYRDRSHYNRLEPHIKLMKQKFMNMEYDYLKAYKWINDNSKGNKKYSYTISIKNIEDKRFRFFKRNNTNQRLDTNLTNLKKELRQFIKGDLVSIDVKNSQPFLLGVLVQHILLAKNYNIKGLSKNIKRLSNNKQTLGNTYCSLLHIDNITSTFGKRALTKVYLIRQNIKIDYLAKFKTFLDSVINGSLYDDFISFYNDGISRKEVKTIMFKVFFSSNKKGHFTPYKNDKLIFAKVYHFVAEIIKILKHKDHALLPIYLQKLESFLFIDSIAKELVNNGIIPFTVHDSVLIEPEHVDRTINIMNSVFKQKIGYTPTLDITPVNYINYGYNSRKAV